MKRMLERMNHVLLAVAVLAVLSLTSCEHKDLCHDSLHVVNVKVVFDWRKAPDAAPASMSLYLFPTHGGEALRYFFHLISYKVPFLSSIYAILLLFSTLCHGEWKLLLGF